MKKIIAAIAALTLIAGLMASCGKKDGDTKVTEADTTATETTVDDSAADAGTPEEVISAVYEKQEVGFKVGNIPVDMTDANALKAYTGLDSADKISAVAASESMMGSQAYSLVVVKLNDAADAEAVAEEMKAGINPRKWVCVEADDLRVVAAGDVVMLIMVSTELADSVTADAIVEAFTEVCGTLTADIK